MPSDEVLGLSVSVRRGNFNEELEKMANKELADSARYVAYLHEILEVVQKNKQSTELPEGLQPVKPDEFKGLPVREALKIYLRARKGPKIPLDVVVNDLEAGGTKQGRPRPNQADDRHALISQGVKTTLANNHHVFDFHPKESNPKTGFVTVGDVPDEEVTVWVRAVPLPLSKRRRD